jgi:Glycosyl hydrolases family 16/LysM domain
MPRHARHRRPSSHNATLPRAALTIAFTGATAALPLVGGASAPAAASTTPRPDQAPHAERPGTAGHRTPRPGEHVVRPGENLSEIAAELRLPGGWRALYAANRRTVGPNPGLIRPGERLRIPVGAASPSPSPSPKPSGAPAPGKPPAPHTVTPASAPAPAPAADSGPLGIPGSWTPVFDDEFNGDSLDTANWNTGWLASGITPPVNPDEQECYDPTQVSVGGGYLHLDAVPKSEECGGQTRPYASGMVNTDGLHEFTDGAFEARIYLPASPDGGVADWPAFWADGQNWPADGEMDVMEGLSGQTCYHYHDPSGGPGGCTDAGPGWHTYGAQWQDGTVTYYYDGHDVGSTSTGGVNAPQYLILNNAVGGAGGQTEPSDMLVDYVRAWQRTS